MTSIRRLSAAAIAVLAFGSAVHAQSSYPDDAAVARAQVQAKAAIGPCVKTLKAGRMGPACTRYHMTVLQAISQQNRRLAWCGSRMAEDSLAKVSNSCITSQNDLGLPEVARWERKVSPKTWKAFDSEMARASQ